MGEYFNWVNVDKKEYLCPSDFGLGSKRLESVSRGNPLLAALHTLLADEWRGDHILLLGDESPNAASDDCETLCILAADARKRGDGYYDDTIMETYRNVSGLFRAAEAEVRQELRFYLDDWDDYRRGKRTEPPLNEYGINVDRPFDGLFVKDGCCFPYIVNYTKKLYYTFGQTRIRYADRTESTTVDPLPLLLEYGRRPEHGSWLGDRIGVSREIDETYALMKEIVLPW